MFPFVVMEVWFLIFVYGDYFQVSMVVFISVLMYSIRGYMPSKIACILLHLFKFGFCLGCYSSCYFNVVAVVY